jgi:hypothetical protein
LIKKDNDEICERTADIDLRTSVVKPLHAKWLIKCHETLERDHEFITRAFKAVGNSMYKRQKSKKVNIVNRI